MFKERDNTEKERERESERYHLPHISAALKLLCTTCTALELYATVCPARGAEDQDTSVRN